MTCITLKSTGLLILLSLHPGCGMTDGRPAVIQEEAMVHVQWSTWNNTPTKIGASSVRSTEEPYTNYVHTLGSFPNVQDSPPFGGYRYHMYLPEEVDISWETLLPNSDAKVVGDIRGPYRIKIRSRIPSELLALAARDNRWRNYILQISISVGKLPTLMNWRLLEHKESLMGFTQSNREIYRGGDSVSWVEHGADNKETPINVFR